MLPIPHGRHGFRRKSANAVLRTPQARQRQERLAAEAAASRVGNQQGRNAMTIRSSLLSCSAVLLYALAGASAASAAATCESLAGLQLPDVTSITAKSFPGGTFQPPDPAG